MKLIRNLTFIATTASVCLLGMHQVAAQDGSGEGVVTQTPAAPQRAASISELLRLVEEARLTETEEQREREQRFQNNANEQQAMLDEMSERRDNEERISSELEAAYNENERIKAERFDTLQERLGDLDELFGTISGVVGDTRSNLESSLISAQYPGRGEFLGELAEILTSDSRLPSTQQLERMWYSMLQEISESGNIVKFDAEVAASDGTLSTQEVVRVGTYNMMSNGQYLRYNPTTTRLSILPSQPDAYTSGAADLQNLTSGYTKVGIDPTGPTGGGFLSALISYPSLTERIEQGGTIGYLIMILGVVGALFAIERLITLTIVSARVRAQLKRPEKPSKGNPVGRVLLVYEEQQNEDIETLELKLGEAVLKETPALERFLTLLKIISTVAPLMGLLGTVTGMITVFQAITLFGTGDPQVMAGGISAALVTTVQGLWVAIPIVLLHTLVKTRSDRIIHVLEEQATGLIAQQAEEQGRTSA